MRQTKPLRGIVYDVGVDYKERLPSISGIPLGRARRDFSAIRADLGCEAVMIVGSRPKDLEQADQVAAGEGLSVWLLPRLFNESIETLRETVNSTAEAAERLRVAGASATLVVGSQLSMSMPGMLPGSTLLARTMMFPVTQLLLPRANRRLQSLRRAVVKDVRERFRGPISYLPGSWEKPDWSVFDVVGVHGHRHAKNAAQFEDQLRDAVDSAHAQNKPLYVLEFGACALRGASRKLNPAAGVVRRGEILSVRRGLVRDEEEQADYIIGLLDTFDRSGVDGSFLMGFSEPLLTTSENPDLDLDIASYGVVALSPDGSWKPKSAYHALAERARCERNSL